MVRSWQLVSFGRGVRFVEYGSNRRKDAVQGAGVRLAHCSQGCTWI